MLLLLASQFMLRRGFRCSQLMREAGTATADKKALPMFHDINGSFKTICAGFSCVFVARLGCYVNLPSIKSTAASSGEAADAPRSQLQTKVCSKQGSYPIRQRLFDKGRSCGGNILQSTVEGNSLRKEINKSHQGNDQGMLSQNELFYVSQPSSLRYAEYMQSPCKVSLP